MENKIWEQHENNTNIAEAAQAQANREGKRVKTYYSNFMVCICYLICILFSNF